MKKFGHYEVTAELGRGGMGVVYRGWEPSLNRKVAIKCLGEHLLNDDDLVERFTREAKATAALNDPNVIQIYYIGKEQNQPFFAMEYIDGQSLDDIIQGGNALSVQHAKNILKQACRGLSAAHKKDLVHRDIKPANIMITDNGTLKIVDFGIARTREYGDKLTNTGEFVGTPGYLSPEVCIGKEVDARSDIFSLGIVFYEMLAGKVPFENDSPLGLMLEVVQSEIPDIRALNKKVDKKTSYILNKMIAKSPEERYQSCEEIIRDLGNVCDKQPISSLRKGAVQFNHPEKNKSNISEQVTLPSGAAAITQQNTMLPSKQKSSKSWLVAATLFAVVGAASVGYYNGYLPFPSNKNENQSVALIDNELLAQQQIVDNNTENGINPNNSNSSDSNQNSENINSNNDDKTDLMANMSDMFAEDDQEDVAKVDNSSLIDFPKNQDNEELAHNIQSREDNSGFQIDVVQPNKGQLNNDLKQAQLSSTSQSNHAQDMQLSEIDTTTLQSVAHNPTKQNNGIVESKMTTPPVQVETHAPLTKQIEVKKTPIIKLNKGVAVIAFGDPAVANPIEKIIESQLKQQGVKVMNEQFISGMQQQLEQGLDLAEIKRLIEKNGGQAMIIANVNYVGSQELLYAGRATELVNAQVDIDTYDIKTGDSIGTGFGSQINYTSLNATDQASDVVMQYTDQLVVNLKNKI
ncbi:MAG: serine/threonine-protein kinase [Marinicellaceae bacterium]